MSFNTFGLLFRVTTFGESHGPAIGCVIDGCPSGVPLEVADIQRDLDRRRPGRNRFTTQRKEPDSVTILSGVCANAKGAQVTSGTPIALLIENVDQRSKDYSEIAEKVRPGHADFTYLAKYGVRDPRGGGRSSARETAMRVAAGAVARKILSGITIRGALVRMGEHPIDRTRWDWNCVDENPFFCPDPIMATFYETYLDEARKNGSSLGAVIEIVAEGAPPGLGAPVYGKLDADLAGALMGINAVKAVEIGAGFTAATLRGEDNVDQIRVDDDGKVSFLTNNSGGILGGISTGQPIVARFAVKPTSSISKALRTVSASGDEVEIATHGRHDPCVGVRATPIGEAMVACVLADHYLRHFGYYETSAASTSPFARGPNASSGIDS